MMNKLDRIRGSLMGGAAGDALGYPVEFWGEGRIFDVYEEGIRAYALQVDRGLAVVSDDTQMTLFTAASLLYALRRQKRSGVPADFRRYTMLGYLNWLHTQYERYSEETRIPEDLTGEVSACLRDVAELYVPRAPGNTCLSSLIGRRKQLEMGKWVTDYLADPLNDSKGCGGIMRVAPIGCTDWDASRAAMEAAQNAAITHGHSLGYMPAAVLAYLVNRLVNCDGKPELKALILEARDRVAELFAGDPNVGRLTELIDLAVRLSENQEPDLDNLHRLGQGWVAEEALAIPLYCCLKYQNDFSMALTVSVNHNGDSDSTGAITGNILGALVGYRAIDRKWTEKLEMHDLILQLADQMYEEFHL